MKYTKDFTDIEFNPKKSLNCQARSAAIFVSLERSGLLQQALSSPAHFKEIVYNIAEEQEKPYEGEQLTLFIQAERKTEELLMMMQILGFLMILFP